MFGFVKGRCTAQRLLTIVVVAAATALGSATAAEATAQPLPEGAGTYLACPDVQTLTPSGTYSCESLTQAVTDAESWNNTGQNTRENATIDLLPGEYCPIELPYDPYPITIQGVGFAGLENASDVTSYTGFEAQLSEFTWNASTCSGTPTDYLDNQSNPDNPNEIAGKVTLKNFAVANASGGPNNGIYVHGADLDVSDLLVTGLSGTGLYWPDVDDFYDAGVDNSAFIGNGVGADIAAGNSTGGSIDESTFANNTVGVEGGGFFNLGGDTIAHNTTGISGGVDQLATSIVGGNTTNCSGSVSDFGENVLGSGCPNNGTTDVTLVSTIGAVSTGNEITPSIQPVTEADDIVDAGICGNLDGTDQEERIVSSSCAAGSIQPNGSTGDPTPSSAIDFGAVPTNNPAQQPASVSAAGGLVGVSGVDVAVDSGTGSFEVTSDRCTYTLLAPREFGQGGCQVFVQATSTDTSGTTTGTLTFHTTDGDKTVSLTAEGAPAITAAAAPTGLGATGGNHRVTLTWTGTTDNGGISLQYYEVQDSTDGGANWQDLDNDYDTSDTPVSDPITGLTNGTSYDFRVRAENGVVDGTWSDTVSATPHAPQQPSALSPPHSATINTGSRVTLSSKLTDTTTGSAIAGAGVKLLARLGSSGQFRLVKNVTTMTDGVASVAVQPVKNVQYEFTYAATTSHGGATSAIATVKVAQVISAALNKSKVKHRKAVNVYGTVLPSASGEQVTLQRDVRGKWNKVGSGTTKKQKLPNGKTVVGYVVKYKPRAKGKEKLRVVRAADTTNLGATSKTLTLKVT